MKRITAGLVAVATAISLSPAAASAADNVTSSNIDKGQYNQWLNEQLQSPQSFAPGFGSALLSSDNKQEDVNRLESSLKNDAANDYKIGTTFTILWATTLSLTILGALYSVAQQQGLLPR